MAIMAIVVIVATVLVVVVVVVVMVVVVVFAVTVSDVVDVVVIVVITCRTQPSQARCGPSETHHPSSGERCRGSIDALQLPQTAAPQRLQWCLRLTALKRSPHSSQFGFSRSGAHLAGLPRPAAAAADAAAAARRQRRLSRAQRRHVQLARGALRARPPRRRRGCGDAAP